ncbi:polyprenyl synthetase family protein [Actinomadura fulvescens]|uniref:Polyprenyl synthetase family protein n=1 Tax=Actinomadura fulvescens TaxID=46160 RepID=A0ABN3QXX5_9ACTN
MTDTERSPAAVPAGLTETVRLVSGLVDRRLAAVLRGDQERYAALGAHARDVVQATRAAAFGGGKRLRPALAFLGFVGAGGDPGDRRVVDLGVALELLHTACLVHDDVMDGSAARRGMPATHVAFAAMHRRRGYAGEPRRFGEGVAIAVGDFAFLSAMGLLAEAGTEVRREFTEMAKDVCVGQYLDLLAAARPADGTPDPEVVVRYKTARYTVQGPLRLGAALAGRLGDLRDALDSYGRLVGVAYRLRDDLIGALADPAVTGEPAGDDPRQGRHIPLLELARARLPAADLAGNELLDRVADGRLREGEIPTALGLLRDLGVHEHVARACAELTAEAGRAIERVEFAAGAKDSLLQFAAHVADV